MSRSEVPPIAAEPKDAPTKAEWHQERNVLGEQQERVPEETELDIHCRAAIAFTITVAIRVECIGESVARGFRQYNAFAVRKLLSCIPRFCA
jgi:hypothetical protein